MLIERWRREFNEVCPHCNLGYWSPTTESIGLFEDVAGSPVQSKTYSKVESCRCDEHYDWAQEWGPVTDIALDCS